MVVFFFQAEDGIRDLVRSRGLGDVYKRQAMSQLIWILQHWRSYLGVVGLAGVSCLCLALVLAVSYTHLTLPTSDLV